MEQIWVNLLNTLHRIMSIYQAILALGEEKKQILVAAKTQDLENITKQEEMLVLEVAKLEELRKTLVSEIMTIHGVKNNKTSLEELKKIAKPEVMEQLTTFSKEFNEIIAKIQPLNKLNTELIQQALGFINFNINILSQTTVGPTYAAKGQSDQHTPKKSMFDAKA